jgi:hypothetical protein
VDGLLNCSERKLGRRDPTGSKKLPHLDDFFLGQIAMSVPECGRMLIEFYTDSIAGLVVNLRTNVLQEVHDLLEIDIRADRMSE